MTNDLVDVWKKAEYVRFLEYLTQLESAKMAELGVEVKKVKQIESKLRLKLLHVEAKERQLESELKKNRQELAEKLKNSSDENFRKTKILEEQHSLQLKSLREKLIAEEAKRKSVELELARSRKKDNASVGESARLQMKEFELEQALEREKILAKSRDHFRNAVLRLTTGSNEMPNPMTTRLAQTRADLLNSGMYCETDELILQIDRKIGQII